MIIIDNDNLISVSHGINIIDSVYYSKSMLDSRKIYVNRQVTCSVT